MLSYGHFSTASSACPCSHSPFIWMFLYALIIHLYAFVHSRHSPACPCSHSPFICMFLYTLIIHLYAFVYSHHSSACPCLLSPLICMSSYPLDDIAKTSLQRQHSFRLLNYNPNILSASR